MFFFRNNGNLPLGELFRRQAPTGSSSRPIRVSNNDSSSSSSAASDSENSGDSVFLPTRPSFVIPHDLRDPQLREREAEKARVDKAFFDALEERQKEERRQRKMGYIHSWRESLQIEVDRRHQRRRTQSDADNNRLLFWEGKLQERRVLALIEFYRLLGSGLGRGEASSIIAKVKGWGKYHGPRRLRMAARDYEINQELPSSGRGQHNKVYSLLDDPDVCQSMREFVRQHKSRIDPGKLRTFAKESMIPAAMEKEARDGLPRDLNRYVCLTLLPRINYQPIKTIGIATARRWLRREGFRYTAYTKDLYLDGHDRQDVLDYRQKVYIPRIQSFRPKLISYENGKVDKQHLPTLDKPQNHILLFHDECAFTANDGQKSAWVLNKSFDLRKKGAGRGIHRSDFICAPFGWMRDAGVQISYGKAHDGYWTSEDLVI